MSDFGFCVTDGRPCVNWRHGSHAGLVREIVMCESELRGRDFKPLWRRGLEPSCAQHASPTLVHLRSLPSVIYFPFAFLRLLDIHSFFQKSTRYSGPGRKSVRCWSKTYPAYSPRGYYLCYLWAPAGFLPPCLSWNASRSGPAWHSPPPPTPSGPARRLALQLFLKRLEFNQNMQLLRSVLFKPKMVFPYFSAHWSQLMVLSWEGREHPFFSYKEAKA